MAKYAVIFKTKRDLPVSSEYLEINKRMVELVSNLKGYLGVDSVVDKDGKGMSISYWDSLESIREWKSNSEHREAQSKGKLSWYKYYKVEICEIVEEYEGGYQHKRT